MTNPAPPARILIIRVSSMGDLIHTMPVVSDIALHCPGAVIDWLVEDSLASIPPMHPAVHRVIPFGLRRWRRAPIAPGHWKEIGALRRELRAQPYDLVIELQEQVKTAAVARWARRGGGCVAGFDRETVREPLATRFYDRHVHAPRTWSAIRRYRSVAASALGYGFDDAPRFGLTIAPLAADWLPAGPYAALMPSASRDAKLWPEDRWTAVGRRLTQAGLACVVFGGSQAERERARRLADAIGSAIVSPPLELPQAAAVLAGATLAVGLDTGFTHFAAALGRPSIGVFCDSSSTTAPVTGDARCASFGEKGAPPSLETVQAALDAMLAERA